MQKKHLWILKNREIFARVLFSRNFAYAKFCENKIPTNLRNHSAFYWYRQITTLSRIFNVTDMCFNAIREYKIIAKISEFTVIRKHHQFLLYLNARCPSSSRITRVFVLCPWARHFIGCLILFQPRKTGNHPDMTRKLLTATSSINKNKQTLDVQGQLLWSLDICQQLFQNTSITLFSLIFSLWYI